MDPTDPGAALAPAEAARELRMLAGYDVALRQRMEGVLWMVLGLVLACTFLGYAFAVVEGMAFGFLAFFWLPWAAAGLAIVWGMRRALALSAGPTGASAWWPFVGLAATSLVALGAFLVGGSEIAPAAGLLALSALALAPALSPSLGYTALGRRVGLVLGALGIVAAIGVFAAGGGGTAGTWAAASMSFLWVMGGVYQVLQG